MVELAEKNNPTASFAVMDAREIGELDTKFDAIIAGFCIPYFSPTECKQFVADAKHLLNEQGLIYISFVEGAPSQSGLKTSKSGDSVYFNYHELETLKALLKVNGFQNEHIFKVDFKRSENEIEVHTVLISKNH